MKRTDKTNSCFYCKQKVCTKKRQVWKQLINTEYSAALLRKTKAVAKSHGLYCIRTVNGEILYIGYSDRSVRKRLLAHCGGYDRQAIGKFLKGKDLRDFLLSWVEERKAECLEEQFIEFAAQEQGVRPRFNMKRGRSCGRKEE
ncbi:uncharacterized protein LOC127718033 isoform X2 [Mytilus californianus]|uniref:uncharacterized protein LOC127718033 isoform X1 n=1 Tax=Mytilus californianus TaxID=6549 RepID=UPI002245A013|nr:uncharacterized protein LOC127718033 isoform X1 [Mytilus californianus]XP_052079886.1 uncharacterized protein LOC127718033 isoform X2 [Mytilus californianus]